MADPQAIVTLGSWLRRRRHLLGLTHAALAEQACCSVSALRKIEQDLRRPSTALAGRLAARLQVEPADRERLVAIARGQRRVHELAQLAPPASLLQACGLRTLPPPGGVTPSVAVLPFVVMAAAPAIEGLADGLVDELIDRLAAVPGLRVAPRTSSFALKGSGQDLATQAARLGVATVVEGSVRHAGARVRVCARLVEAASDTRLWGRSFDRVLDDDVLDWQDALAGAAVDELRHTLLGERPPPVS